MRLAKILLPIDFSERGAGAAHYARTLACRFRSEVTLLHVFELQKLIFAGAEAAIPAEWYGDRQKESQGMLDEAYADEFRNVAVRRLFLEGDVARTIADVAHTEHSDLIVMPTHG